MKNVFQIALIALIVLSGIVSIRADDFMGIDLGQSWTVAEIKSGAADKDPDIAAFKFALAKMETKVFFSGDKASFVVVYGENHKTGYHCSGVTISRGHRQAVTEADRLNGIQKKWFFHITSKAYRKAEGSKWSAWQNGVPPLTSWTAVYLQMKNGTLTVADPSNYNKLQRWEVKQ